MGINDSKELCYLHLTNPIEQDLILEATKLAQAKCLERVNWLKELAASNIKEREIPLYKRTPGPRNIGTLIDISELEKNLPSMEDLTLTDKVDKKTKPKDKRIVPNIKISDIEILEEMCL